MAKLAKEVTTVQRVLESLFRYFDNENLWSPQHGLALAVLLDMQMLMEKTGQNTHLLLSVLVKHLKHKNVIKRPDMQLDIVQVTTSLAQQSKIQTFVAIISAIFELIKHLQKCIHFSLDDGNPRDDIIKWNAKYQAAVDECLVQLSNKVGDAGPILDIMAVVLENISTSTIVEKTTISVVYHSAQIIAAIPNLSYHNKAIAMGFQVMAASFNLPGSGTLYLSVGGMLLAYGMMNDASILMNDVNGHHVMLYYFKNFKEHTKVISNEVYLNYYYFFGRIF
ncbi:protein SEMI-ROLLED LEAF 2-like [Magnolia sinica]|uniref:protein SEMI-ROLLED LEAF 2-like n=1 Tax=Magnolia sinica TaxID=86752 RepID=UPI0026587F67|nr:protein SEMI-ROLLED LEAF 2-like [Magnolia sinica]